MGGSVSWPEAERCGLCFGDADVKVGMSSTAEIQTEQVNDALLVPTRAITTSGENKTITVLEATTRARVTIPVKTGLVSDGLMLAPPSLLTQPPSPSSDCGTDAWLRPSRRSIVEVVATERVYCMCPIQP